MGGVTNHIKAFKLHLLKDQRDFLLKALKFKHLKYAGENTVSVVGTQVSDSGLVRRSITSFPCFRQPSKLSPFKILEVEAIE